MTNPLLTFTDLVDFAAIRPEGFELDANGALECKLSNVEVMGRDVSVVSTHEAALVPAIRSIINADNKIAAAETVSYTLKPHKVFLFDKETEEKIVLGSLEIIE